MSTFILQSMFLLAAAYLLGSVVGCWMRKMFTQSASMLHRVGDELATEPALATAGVGAVATAGATRYAGEDGEASIEIKRPEPAYRETTPIEPTADETPAEVQTEFREEPQSIVAPIDLPHQHENYSLVEHEVDLEPEIEIEEVSDPVVSAPKVEHKSVAKPIIDDLTRIKGVGLPVALELKKNGITRFEQVARWSDGDIAEISEKLGFTGRIERENWMAQAQILATGEELEFTTHQLTEAEQNTRSRDIGKLISNANSVAREAMTGAGGTDDLKRVVGIGAHIEGLLNEIGITRFSQIASWNADEIAAISRRLDIEGRIERENWVQQARNLDSTTA